MKPKIAIILDNLSIQNWQKDALNEAKEKFKVELILNCKNSFSKKKFLKNFFYYLINIFSLKNNFTSKNTYNISNIKVINFNAVNTNGWQKIPKNVISELSNHEIKFIIKFGMNLIYINSEITKFPILSYHHGDPSKYRGRPAGFYEILNNEKKVGIIVQKINNKLDAGQVLAYGESKVLNFSYKKTSINFYHNSKFLLSKAIDNLLSGNQIEIKKNGKNYNLPNNFISIKFIFIIFYNYLKRLNYGVFFEKKWKVAIFKNYLSFKTSEEISLDKLIEIPITKQYSFYADPFFDQNYKKIRVEGLNKYSGLGELIEISIDDLYKQKKIISGQHYSYPFSFLYENNEYLIPEVASFSPPFMLNSKNKNKIFFKGLEDKRIIDATLVNFEKNWYLFFGKNDSASSILYLWFAKTPFDKFKPHPKSPIVISPNNARMGGGVINFDGQLLRFGQNNEGQYGELLSIQEINELTPNNYKERYVGNITIEKFKGPHTLNFNFKTKQILIDYYSERFSFFAGVRRLLGRYNSI